MTDKIGVFMYVLAGGVYGQPGSHTKVVICGTNGLIATFEYTHWEVDRPNIYSTIGAYLLDKTPRLS